MVENTHSSELISSIDKIVGDTTFAGAQSRQALHQAAVRLARATADPGEESGRLMMHVCQSCISIELWKINIPKVP